MISVIIPVYNTEQYLHKCIESVRKQTYKEWEIILVNDGSTDKSLEICQEYEKIDQRIKCIDKKNGGVSSARNLGLKHVFGEWVFLLDADDWIDSYLFEKLLGETKEDVDIVWCDFQKFSQDEENEEKCFSGKNIIVNDTKELIKGTMFPAYIEQKYGRKLGAIKGAWAKLIRTELIKKNEIKFDENIEIGEDALFSAMCFQCANNAVFIDEKLYYYRIDNISATRKYREDIVTVYQNLLDGFGAFIKPYLMQEGFSTSYGGLTYACVARALEKYFFHPENQKSHYLVMKELKQYLADDRIQRGVDLIKEWNLFQAKQKMVIWCIKHKFPTGLYVLSTIKNSYKKMKE